MNGSPTGDEGGDDDLRSPAHKRGGSSKTSTRRSAHRVSPPDVTIPANKSITFSDEKANHLHNHKRMVYEASIVVKDESPFDQFIKSIASFISNAQMVYKYFVINALDPKSKEWCIVTEGDISNNMTKLGVHIRISGSGNASNKKKIWNENSERKSRKASKKEEFCDPVIFFSFVASSDVNPQENINRTAHEWNKAGGTHLMLKELQDVDSETAVSLFKVSTATCKEVLLAKLRSILGDALNNARLKYSACEFYSKYDCSYDSDSEGDLPKMILRLQQAKLQGVDTSSFNKLKYYAQMARRSWHLEVATRHATKMKNLVQYAKENGFIERLWGRHSHLSEVTEQQSTAREARKQVEVAQSHTNNQVSMVGDELSGIINVDATADVLHPLTGEQFETYSLHQILMHFIKMGDGCQAIAEVHQKNIQHPTYVVIPNTKDAEVILSMMNRNLPAYLCFTLHELGFPDDFIKSLVERACEAATVAKSFKYQWDETTKSLTSKKEKKADDALKSFEHAAWYKDEFGLLDRAKSKEYTVPEALFNLDGAASQKTIHDRHEGTKPTSLLDKPGTPPQGVAARKEKLAIEIQSSSSESESSDDSDRDSASHSRSSGFVHRSRSKDSREELTSSNDMEVLSVTGGG